ncbi:MAG TPA: 50S ribosomal protein L9, partial [Chromatiaceae bacterium]|nr:50S ribosomal protein L9 [Chromatiaceae bacterium]
FARNFLIPTGKAKPATAANLAEFEATRAEHEKAAEDALGVAEKRGSALSTVAVTIARRAGDEGKLFGSVGTTDIAEAVTAAGVGLAKKEVRLPDGAFHNTGEYDVVLHLHTDVNITIKVTVVAED